MKKLLSLLLTFSLVLSSVVPCWSQAPDSSQATAPISNAAPITDTAPASKPALNYSDFAEQGKRDAQETGTGGAFTIGVVSGLGLGFIGTVLACGFQGEPEAPPAKTEPLLNTESRLAYTTAYGKEGKRKKRGAALVGGLIGTAALVSIIVASGYVEKKTMEALRQIDTTAGEKGRRSW